MRWGPPPRGGGGGGYHVLGVWIPRPIAWLMALVIFMSAGGSLLQRARVPLLSLSVLDVNAVWHGEIWRLLSWSTLALDPLGLLFGCLVLYFFGPDLLRRWGARRFFLNFFGGAAVVGATTCLIGRYLSLEVYAGQYQGLWAMEDAMIIAWATLFSDRQILLFFALPTSGRNLIVLTIAITVVMAAMSSFPFYVPHFVAELAALLYMDIIPTRSAIARGRLAWFQRGYRRRTAKLTRIDRDEPPRWTH
jgi:membrane associated rhomboid family serine protease